MQIVVEKVNLPEKGHVEFGLHRSFEITITSDQARSKVKRWLWAEVSMLLGTEPPALVLDEVIVWRVPVILIAPGHGTLGTVGAIDVAVQTGDLIDLNKQQGLIEQQAALIAARLPHFQPRTDVYSGSVPTHLPTTSSLTVTGE